MGLLPWVSSAPEPGAGSVQFLPQATLGNTTPTPQEGPGNGLWLGRQHFGPSTLGGWCAGSVLRELPAGTPDFASRQSAPSPSGRSGGGWILGPDRLDAAKRPAARPAPVQSADVSVRANTRTIPPAPRLAHQISNRGGDPATGRWGGFSVESWLPLVLHYGAHVYPPYGDFHHNTCYQASVAGRWSTLRLSTWAFLSVQHMANRAATWRRGHYRPLELDMGCRILALSQVGETSPC
ncbi:hypothetical protein CFAM422_005485 [Trichoderma lentiforme]|uniref:Uncharacterized protein n=1 Tax=Trichoderma lentiforme TaxID=1567552 RepID=A0A9P4XGS9_9HYPO|nr:hypothetical protein CFAM422_005485 [Trichoderma lentiforme]